MRRHIETAHRPVVMGMNGAVTSGHPLASVAGLHVLERGGSAVDAIVAMASAVGVVEPNMSGVGGDGFTLVYDAAERNVTTVNGTGPAPQSGAPEVFAEGIPQRGPASASVPGAVGGWAAMHKRWGKLPFDEVLAPAISLARDGFPVSYNLAVDLQHAEEALSAHHTTRDVLLPNGRVPQPGDVIRQKVLAESLRLIAGTYGESMYRGELGERLGAAASAAGGVLDSESLAAYEAEVTEPLSVDYRGLSVFEPGPNCSGHVLLQELAMLGLLDTEQWRNPSAELIHHLVEIKKLAFDDRERVAADPRYVEPFPSELLTTEYARDRLRELDPAHSREQKTADSPAPGDTTYLASADRDGNMASMTTSINMSFGSGFIAGDTGILLNNRMTYWHLEPDHPNYLQPGKRVRHTVSPAIALDGLQPAMAIGTPGSDGQVQTVFQVLVNILNYGMNLQEAVERPRWRSFVDGQDANWPHRCATELHVEGRIPAAVIEGLQARGHKVIRQTPWAMGVGSVQVIRADSERGVFSVGSDPRRDAYGLAF